MTRHAGWAMLTQTLRLGQGPPKDNTASHLIPVTAACGWAEHRMTGLVGMHNITGSSSQLFLRSIKREGGWTNHLHAAWAPNLSTFPSTVFLVYIRKSTAIQRTYILWYIFISQWEPGSLFLQWSQLHKPVPTAGSQDANPSPHYCSFPKNLNSSLPAEAAKDILKQRKMPAEP